MSEPFIIYRPNFRTRWPRPLVGCHVTAGFPSPAEDWIESRLDLDRDLIRHPVATFYVRVRGDSMIDLGIADGSIAVVDRAEETCSGHVVVARVGSEFTIKRLRITSEGEIWLDPANSMNDEYQPVCVTEGMDFEVWGRVVWSFRPHWTFMTASQTAPVFGLIDCNNFYVSCERVCVCTPPGSLRWSTLWRSSPPAVGAGRPGHQLLRHRSPLGEQTQSAPRANV